MNSKHQNGFCYLLKVKEKIQKREKRKRRRDICLYLILSAGTIAGTLNLLVSARIKKPCYILMSPRVETYSLCCLPIELLSFACFFSASFDSIYSRQISYSPLKILYGKLELSTTINNNTISKPRGPYLPLSWGW